VIIPSGQDGPAYANLTGGNDALQAEVRVAVNLSRFKPECKGRKIEIVYVFTLQDPPTDTVIPPAVRFVPPNRFELTFRRVKPNPEPPAPVKLPPSPQK
jgi:hypothetical protein